MTNKIKMSELKLITAAILPLTCIMASPLVHAAPWEGEKAVAKIETQESGVGSNTTSIPNTLQVSGTTNNFTISAQHADVLSLLKLAFAQAHRQFVPDASVTGDVTFSLAGQKFETVLSAICRQAILRYVIDSNGIYQFRRDDEALRNMLLKTQAINRVIMDQLRGMGYTIPNTAAGRSASGGVGGGSNDRGAGFGEKRMSPDSAVDSTSARSLRLSKSPENVTGAPRVSSPDTEASIGKPYGLIGDGALPNLEDGTQYQVFMKQNHLVYVNTKGEDMAVRDILLDMGRQAGIAILIDPAVPHGKDFVLNGSISARPMAELLNILAYKAHLEWRWVNNRILVTTTPQLQFYLRGALLPLPNSGVTVLPSRGDRPAPANSDKKTDSKSEDSSKEKPKD